MTPDGLAMPHVLVGKLLRRRQRQRLLFLDRLAGAHGFAHEIHRIDGINRSGPRGLERLVNRFDVRQKPGQVASPKGARALGEAVSAIKSESWQVCSLQEYQNK